MSRRVKGAFTIVGGFVDLHAGCLAGDGRVVRLSAGQRRVLWHLYRRQRTLVDVADLARHAAVGDDDLADVQMHLRVLERLLGAAPGRRTILRRRGADLVGLWPARAQLEVAGAASLVAVGVDARRLAYRDREPIIEHAWSAVRERWVAAGLEIGAEPVEEGAGAVVFLGPPSARIWSWIDDLLNASAGPLGARLRVAVVAIEWGAGARELAVQAGSERLSHLWERATRGHLVLTDGARRAFDDGGRASSLGTQTFANHGEPELVWRRRGPARLLPASIEPVIPSPTDLPDGIEQIEAVLSAIDGGAGLVVLHGPTGSGKTNLALQVAVLSQRRLRGRGGARFVRLTEDATSLAEQVIAELGLLGGVDPEEASERALAQLGDALLVLDGFERSRSGADRQLLRWREVAPQCVLLLTAPEPIPLPGAVQVYVSPWRGALARAAVRDALAQRGLASFAAQDQAVDKVVHRAGGLPLALQVAAGVVAAEGAPRAADLLHDTGSRSDDAKLMQVLRVARARLSSALQRGLDRLGVIQGDFGLSTASRLLGADLDAAEAVLALLDAGLLRAREDVILGELRLSLPGPVARLVEGNLPRAERARLRSAYTQTIAERAARWVQQVDAGGDERRPLRRLVLARHALMRSLSELPAGSARQGAVVGLLRMCELGHVSLADLVLALGPATPGEAVPAEALARARLALLAGNLAEAEAWSREAERGPSPLREAAQVTRLLAAQTSLAHGVARRELAQLVGRWLVEPQVRVLPAAGAVLDALIAHQLIGDAQQLAAQLTAIAAAHGSVWRRQVIAVHQFRARAMLRQVRPHDLDSIVAAVDVLQGLPDHRTAALGLQWLARHLVAAGEPRVGLSVLDRVQGYLDTYASPALYELLLLDRVRALALSGAVHAARSEHMRLEAAAGGPGRLPLVVHQLDGALLDLMTGEPARALDRLADLGSIPPVYADLIYLLLSIASAWQGVDRPPAASPSWSTPRRALALAELVEVWSDPIALRGQIERVRQGGEFRSVGLFGVVTRALVFTVERRVLHVRELG